MQFFITGTDTNIGKTLIASWIALHTGFPYFKPIQTGLSEGSDACVMKELAGVKIYPEIYAYQAPVSPHLAAKMANDRIDLQKIILPEEENLIIEGAGGVLVPINEQFLMIDLIKKLGAPVILVTRTSLGTINHTLLSLEALRARNIPIAGVVMNGEENVHNSQAIEYYGQIPILAQFPKLASINGDALRYIPLPDELWRKIRE
jgi:dethiobiotin synthetase